MAKVYDFYSGLRPLGFLLLLSLFYVSLTPYLLLHLASITVIRDRQVPHSSFWLSSLSTRTHARLRHWSGDIIQLTPGLWYMIIPAPQLPVKPIHCQLHLFQFEGVEINVVEHRRHDHRGVFPNPRQNGLSPKENTVRADVRLCGSAVGCSRPTLWTLPSHGRHFYFSWVGTKKDFLVSGEFPRFWIAGAPSSWARPRADLKLVSSCHSQATVNEDCKHSEFARFLFPNGVCLLCDCPHCSYNLYFMSFKS